MKLILRSLLVVSLLTTGVFANDPGALTKPSEKVQGMIKKFNLEMVNYNYAKEKVSKGTRNGAKALFIDARPTKKYMAGTIPSSLNIPDTQYAKYIGQLKDVPKNKEILVYCGGWKCGKSPKVANMLKKDGFSNVKLYQAGEPEWKNKNYIEVSLTVVKSVQAKNSAVIIDARPYKMFLKETIPGSLSIPDTKIDELKGKFPIDKMQKIITFCGGYKCAKSHNVANKLISLGYKDVSVFAAGIPAWKEAGLATTKSASKVEVDTNIDTLEKPIMSKNGAKLGADEGSIDGEWLNAFIQKGSVPSFIQIVDVTDPDEFKKGHIKGAINIQAEKLSAKDLHEKLITLAKGKTVIFNCTAGGRSIEAWSKINDAKIDVSEIFYFDANIDCKGNDCKIEVNESIE